MEEMLSRWLVFRNEETIDVFEAEESGMVSVITGLCFRREVDA